MIFYKNPLQRMAFSRGCLDGKSDQTIPTARSARQQAGWNVEGIPKPTVGPPVYWDGVIYRALPCPSEFEVDPVGNLPIAEIRIGPRRPFHGHEVHPIDTERNLCEGVIHMSLISIGVSQGFHRRLADIRDGDLLLIPVDADINNGRR